MAENSSTHKPRLDDMNIKNSNSSDKSDLIGRGLVYVDNDDDVTSLTRKIKAVSETVAALVPPSRIGVLQSVVNLKLLLLAAKRAHKKLVLITTDQSLINLASGLNIAVADNINAQAKIPQLDNTDELKEDDTIDDSDIIDGTDFENRPAGKRRIGKAKVISQSSDQEIESAVAALDQDDRINNDYNANGIDDDEEEDRPKPKRLMRIPNIHKLQRRIIIIGLLAIIGIGGLVWALIYAPVVNITIKASATPVEVNNKLKLVPNGTVDVAEGHLPAIIKQKKISETTPITPTGSKEVGNKAHGQIAICLPALPIDPYEGTENAVTVPAGTRVAINGKQFTTDGPVTVKGGFRRGNNECNERANWYTVRATAVNYGEESNIKSGSKASIARFTGVSAVARGDFSGGSKRKIKVIEQADVDKALAEIDKRIDSDKVRQELKSALHESVVEVNGGFTMTRSKPSYSPAIGEEVTKSPDLSIEVTYTMVGIRREDLNKLIEHGVKMEHKSRDQYKIYDYGIDKILFSDFRAEHGNYFVKLKTTSYIGSVIDENKLRQDFINKKSEEIKQMARRIRGVEDVSVNMSPFWVSYTNNPDKIHIKFSIDQ